MDIAEGVTGGKYRRFFVPWQQMPMKPEKGEKQAVIRLITALAEATYKSDGTTLAPISWSCGGEAKGRGKVRQRLARDAVAAFSTHSGASRNL